MVVVGAATISGASGCSTVHFLEHTLNSHSSFLAERYFSSTAPRAKRRAAAPTSLSCSDIMTQDFRMTQNDDATASDGHLA